MQPLREKTSTAEYRGAQNVAQNIVENDPGRAGKQQQEQTSPNLECTIFCTSVQGDPSGWLKPPVDLIPTVMVAGGPLLQLPNGPVR